MVMLLTSLTLSNSKAFAEVSLFTPYTGLSVTPGESINYSVDIINNESNIQNVTFDVDGLPEDWSYSITADGNDIQQLSILGNSEQTIGLEVSVPLEIEKDDYSFNLVATDENGNQSSLPFLTTVTEEGTFKTELSVDQPNLEGDTGSSFSYSATIQNRTAEEQNYALTSSAPEGWAVQYKADGDNVTSVTVDANSETSVTIDVTPPENATADTYEIPIQVAGSGTSAEETLEAVITGTYDLNVTTPTGNLSTDITAGDSRVIDIVVENTGTAKLTNIELSATTPPNWESEFDKSTITEIEAGESKTVKATLTAGDDALAGDYVTTISASATEASAEADFRVSVQTSTLWGIIGVLIIVGVLGGLYYIYRKYGRR